MEDKEENIEATISVGDKVEITSGVFEGSKALVLRISHNTLSKEEVVVRLLEEETPITIKIFNNGGYILDWTASKERPNDLVENSIVVEGEDDGSFDNNDQILFYGRGVNFWEYDVETT